MKLPIEEKVGLPSGVTASLSGGVLTVKGPEGEVSKPVRHPRIEASIKDDVIVLFCKRGTKREKDAMFTFVAHINNMIGGVQDPYVYRLKVCASHFPMSAGVSGELFEVKNFLGEKSPRKLKLKKGADVKVEGDDITVRSPDIELAGVVASDIERLMTKGTRDQRIFQDGIYIVEKP